MTTPQRFAFAVLASAFMTIAVSATAWITRGGASPTTRLRTATELSRDEVRSCFAGGVLPPSVVLPSYYREPELFFIKRERSAQTAFADWWRLRNSNEKYELLLLVKSAETFELVPFLLEVSWFTTAQETDERVTRSMLDALYGLSDSYIDLATFVCSHIASTTTFPTAQADARRYVADLAERRNRIGY